MVYSFFWVIKIEHLANQLLWFLWHRKLSSWSGSPLAPATQRCNLCLRRRSKARSWIAWHGLKGWWMRVPCLVCQTLAVPFKPFSWKKPFHYVWLDSCGWPVTGIFPSACSRIRKNAENPWNSFWNAEFGCWNLIQTLYAQSARKERATKGKPIQQLQGLQTKNSQ